MLKNGVGHENLYSPNILWCVRSNLDHNKGDMSIAYNIDRGFVKQMPTKTCHISSTWDP